MGRIGTDWLQILGDDCSTSTDVNSFSDRGVPGVSKDRKARVEAIANQLVAGPDEYDFVFLQEVWSKADYKFIESKVRIMGNYERRLITFS